LCCPSNTEEFEILLNTNHNREFPYIISIEGKFDNIKEVEGEKKGNFLTLKSSNLK